MEDLTPAMRQYLEIKETCKDAVLFFRMGDFTLADLDTLVSLKCVAIFARDKADKESKDACDLYALIRYGGKAIKMTGLFKRAIEKVLGRTDLMYAIAEHVLLDPGRQGIVEVALRDTLSGHRLEEHRKERQ